MEFLNVDLADPKIWIAFLSLTLMEIVLGIDNVVFISILAAKLPAHQQKKARRLGLTLAVVTRILLLLGISWIVGLTKPLFSVFGHPVAGRDLILGLGGLFLIAKATHEIHGKLEGVEGHASKRVVPSFASVIMQILILDVVFSLDSVITAVGMVKEIPVMIAAVLVSLAFMLTFAERISHFIERHPTLKMLALSFLILIGVALLAESFHREIPKGYIYFAMAFSIAVEMINLKLRKKTEPVQLHSAYVAEGDEKKSV